MNKLSVTNLFSSTYLLQYIMLTIQKKSRIVALGPLPCSFDSVFIC